MAHLSDNEKAAAALGMTLKEYKASSYYVKVDKKFKKAMKDKGVWDYVKNMSPDQLAFAQKNWQLAKEQTKDNLKKMDQALEQAKKQADPYWKSYLLVAQDEVQRSIEDVKANTQADVERNQRLIQQINENLASNKDFLSLEQQSELANLSRDYEVKQEQIVEGAADAGLTFSTKRKIAEQRLNEYNQGMVESTNRQYNKRISDLETQAASGSLEAQKEIEDLQRRMGQQVTSLGRAAERDLGTENLPQLEGYTPLGNITGSMYEQKVKDIEDRKNAIYNDLTRSSLNFSV